MCDFAVTSSKRAKVIDYHLYIGILVHLRSAKFTPTFITSEFFNYRWLTKARGETSQLNFRGGKFLVDNPATTYQSTRAQVGYATMFIDTSSSYFVAFFSFSILQ